MQAEGAAAAEAAAGSQWWEAVDASLVKGGGQTVVELAAVTRLSLRHNQLAYLPPLQGSALHDLDVSGCVPACLRACVRACVRAW